jgi:hypothetical protein
VKGVQFSLLYLLSELVPWVEVDVQAATKVGLAASERNAAFCVGGLGQLTTKTTRFYRHAF